MWFMCKLMNELFKIEIDFVLKKILKLKTLGYTDRIGMTGEYSKGHSYTLEYADLMDTSVRYQDEKEQVWNAIHTAVELQRQALKDGTETLMPEDMAQYMSANDLDYDMTGGDLLGGNGKLILGVLIGAILGATAATHSKKHV